MPDPQVLVNELIDKLRKRKVKGSLETALQTTELLRSVISAQKLPPTNQAAALINAVRDVGEKLIAANPVELSVGNVVRRVLRTIREEDLSPSSNEAGDNDPEITWLSDNNAPYAAESICPPLMHMLHTFSSAEEKSKC